MDLTHTYKIKKACNESSAKGSELVHKVGSHKNVNEVNLVVRKSDYTIDATLNNKDITFAASAIPSSLNRDD